MTELPDRLLREALRDSASDAPSTACLDAGALAAWADGTLGGGARTAVEAHAARCARCLALLAAMARTEPPPAGQVRWRRSSFAWLVPLATATVALAIVVRFVVIEQRSALPTPGASADSGVTRPSAEVNAPSSVSPAPPAVSAPTGDETFARPLAAAPAAAASRRRERAANAAPSSHSSSASRTGPAAAAGSPVPDVAAKDAAGAAGGGGNVAQRPPPPALPPATQEAAATGSRDDMTRAQRALASGGQPMMKAMTPVPVLILSPDASARWRVVAGVVESTTDGGATWQTQQVGVDAVWRAGAAPAPRVCWLVGAAGSVRRTVDGATWLPVGFPEDVDLVAIQATDASHAVVTTSDGRRFSTSDGGATWTRR